MIVLYDPDIYEGDRLQQALSGEHREVCRTSGSGPAGELVRTRRPSLVVVNLETTGEDGVAFVRRMRHEHPSACLLVSTRMPLGSILADAMEAGADDFFVPGEDAKARLQPYFARGPLQEVLDLEELLPEMARHAVPRPGDWVAHYKLLALLGEGYWGLVFRAFDRHLLREVAIKVLKLVNPPKAELARHLEEARNLAQIAHPGVIRVYDVGRLPEAYIAMELVKGRLLDDYLGRRLPAQHAVQWTVQLLEAVQAVHQRGMVHRDIKPSNIMVTESGRIKLMDFGLAGRPNLGADSPHTNYYFTPMYASPEQFEADMGSVSMPSDLFSVAAVLYEMLTGIPPFDGDSVDELGYKIVHQDPEPLEEIAPYLPPELCQICMKALEKSQAQRFPTAVAFADALRALKLS